MNRIWIGEPGSVSESRNRSGQPAQGKELSGASEGVLLRYLESQSTDAGCWRRSLAENLLSQAVPLPLYPAPKH
jgi:hypothetical protein